MSARDAILARVRHALARTPEEQAAAEAAVRRPRSRPMPATWSRRAASSTREGRVQLFAELAKAVDDRRAAAGDPGRGAGGGQRLSAPAQPAAEAGPGARAAARPRQLGQPAPAAGAPRRRRRRRRRRASRWRSPGVAETGTLVLASAPERPTLLAYLPETSVVVARRRVDRGRLRGRLGIGARHARRACRARSTSSPARRAPPTSPSSSSSARTGPSGS